MDGGLLGGRSFFSLGKFHRSHRTIILISTFQEEETPFRGGEGFDQKNGGTFGSFVQITIIVIQKLSPLVGGPLTNDPTKDSRHRADKKVDGSF